MDDVLKIRETDNEPIRILAQDDDSVTFQVFFRDDKRDWYQLTAKVAKKKLKRI